MSDFFTPLSALICTVSWLALRPLSSRFRIAGHAILFTLISVAVTIAAIAPLQSIAYGMKSGSTLEQQILVTLWWVTAAKLFVEVISLFLIDFKVIKEGRLLSDLVGGAIYISTALLIVNSVFGLPVRALLATSGVIAIVLGLALQSTLSDVFAGIAVGIERPYSVGDRILMDGKIEGTVVQTNWRSVRICTDGDDIAIVPNSVAAKANVLNRSAPTTRRTESLQFQCWSFVTPEDVETIVHEAGLLCPEPVLSARPSVVLTNLGRRFHTYQISLSLPDSSAITETKSVFLKQVAKQLRSRGLTSASGGEGERPRGDDPRGMTPPRIASLPLFAALTEDETNELQDHLSRHTLDPEDVLFRQGDAGGSLFVVASGVLEISRHVDAETTATIGRIGPGDYIGEIGLLTGAPRSAGARALTEAIVYELKKDHLSPLIAEQPRLLQDLATSARRGQALIDRRVAASVAAQDLPSGQLLARIRDYFRVHSRSGSRN